VQPLSVGGVVTVDLNTFLGFTIPAYTLMCDSHLVVLY